MTDVVIILALIIEFTSPEVVFQWLCIMYSKMAEECYSKWLIVIKIGFQSILIPRLRIITFHEFII